MGIKSIGKTAFDAVYEANVDAVYQTALHYSRDEHTAEEITQTVFMKLYMNMENINMDAVSGYLINAAKHTAMNHRRDRSREVLREEIFYDQGNADSAETEFLHKLRDKEYVELAESIFAELYHVNERWYDAITITYHLEKPQKEVAEIMGVSLEVLHSMLYRAKKWIRKNYEEEFDHLNKA